MASAKKIGEIVAAIKTIYPYYSSGADSVTLAKTWMMLLQNVSDEVTEMAFTKCLQICKVPPTPADVLEQVKAITEANEETDIELWIILDKAVKKTRNYTYKFNHTFVEDNGKTQGDNAREKFQEMWDKLPVRLRKYLGGKSELMRIAKYNDEEMKFEKIQFFKSLPAINKRQEYEELSRLISASNNMLLGKEHG